MEYSKLPDDVQVVSVGEPDREGLAQVLRRAFDRAAELATQRNLASPIALTLTDADERCLLTMTLNSAPSGWIGQTGPGELEQRDAIAFPWFLVLQGGAGGSDIAIWIRIELDASPTERRDVS